MTSFFFLPLSLLVLAPIDLPVGSQASYQVTLEPRDGDEAPTRGRFIVARRQSDDDTIDLFWYLAAVEGEQLPWPHRVGRWSYDRSTGQVEQPAARLVVRYDGSNYRVDLPIPLMRIPIERVEQGTWESGSTSFRIVRREEKQGVDCWRVEVENALGFRATIWVESDSDQVIATKKSVILGRGVPFELKYHRESRWVADAAQLTTVQEQTESLLQAVAEQALDFQQRDWNPDADAQEILLDLLESLPPTDQELAVSAAVDEGLKEVERLARRSRSTESLRNAIVGKPLPDFDLARIGGQRLTKADLEGKVVVLHFWKYRNENLSPPYGQVGYLDFVARRQSDADVVVLGVTQVASASADEREHRAQVESGRKLREFMNLSFPILVDDGEFLKAVGDPTQAKEKLPLWVVVGPDGVVRDYQVGLQEVEGNRGLTIVNRWIDEARRND